MNLRTFQEIHHYLENIHLFHDEKIKQLKSISGLASINLEDIGEIEELTFIFLRKRKKTNENFFYWLYIIGSYIKTKYDGQWILIQHDYDNFSLSMPAVVSKSGEIWQVGHFCFKYYYFSNNMDGIRFETFVKLKIDRIIWRPKYWELNIPLENFHYIEKTSEN